jgi:hypothetical protein
MEIGEGVIKLGYDIYLKWEGMTENDKERQITGFSLKHGHVGYLRASIHFDGLIDIFKQLFKEAWTGYNEGEIELEKRQLEKRYKKLNWAKFNQNVERWEMKEERVKEIKTSVENFVHLAESKLSQGLKTVVEIA